jgi:hypothetical protein
MKQVETSVARAHMPHSTKADFFGLTAFYTLRAPQTLGLLSISHSHAHICRASLVSEGIQLSHPQAQLVGAVREQPPACPALLGLDVENSGKNSAQQQSQ